MAKLPPLPARDGVARDHHIAVSVPGGTPAAGFGAESAVVRRGYSENGPPEVSPAPAGRRPVSRAPSPVGNSILLPAKSRVPCTNGYEIAFPLLPGRIARFQVECRDRAGNLAGIAAQGVAGESWSVVLGPPPVPAGRPPLPPRPHPGHSRPLRTRHGNPKPRTHSQRTPPDHPHPTPRHLAPRADQRNSLPPAHPVHAAPCTPNTHEGPLRGAHPLPALAHCARRPAQLTPAHAPRALTRRCAGAREPGRGCLP
jgi:hypothetical protein